MSKYLSSRIERPSIICPREIELNLEEDLFQASICFTDLGHSDWGKMKS